jgi:hypothetical protein
MRLLPEGLVTVTLKAKQSAIYMEQRTGRCVLLREMCRAIDALLPRIAHAES